MAGPRTAAPHGHAGGLTTRALVAVLALAALLGSLQATPVSATGVPAATVVASDATNSTTPPWHRRLDRLLDGRDVGVSVRLDGSVLYSRRGRRDRVPASNQKLLVTMALLEMVDPSTRLPTTATAEQVTATTVHGDLWLVGSGDPSLTGGDKTAGVLSYRRTRLQRLARKVRDVGITRITGSVNGDVSGFSRDWWAPGWRSHYPARYAPLASGLAFDGNVVKGRHITDPEARAARSLTKLLRALGVRVDRRPSTGVAPAGAQVVAEVHSVPLVQIVRHMNRSSSNFHAETLGKYLGAAAGRGPSIAGGAATVEQWAAERGVVVTANDASGLSWANRASTGDIATLLDATPAKPALRATLVRPGKGTLEKRLRGVRVRAKTGTLPGHSALSGYVHLRRRNEWAAFSILSQGMSKSAAAALEDRIVTLLEQRGR